MKISKKVLVEKLHEGEKIPRGYGLAYWKVNESVGVCYLMPFNLVVKWLRDIIIYIKNPLYKTDKLARTEHELEWQWTALRRIEEDIKAIKKEKACLELKVSELTEAVKGINSLLLDFVIAREQEKRRKK